MTSYDIYKPRRGADCLCHAERTMSYERSTAVLPPTCSRRLPSTRRDSADLFGPALRIWKGQGMDVEAAVLRADDWEAWCTLPPTAAA